MRAYVHGCHIHYTWSTSHTSLSLSLSRFFLSASLCECLMFFYLIKIFDIRKIHVINSNFLLITDVISEVWHITDFDFYTLGSIFAVHVWIACTPVQYIDWLSQDNWMDWACSLRRTGLHPIPMDNQSVTCTRFAEPNQIRTCMYLWYVYVCGCNLPRANDQELGTNNYSVRESLWLSILDEFVGAFKHHAQHCTWLWPPSQ